MNYNYLKSNNRNTAHYGREDGYRRPSNPTQTLGLDQKCEELNDIMKKDMRNREKLKIKFEDAVKERNRILLIQSVIARNGQQVWTDLYKSVMSRAELEASEDFKDFHLMHFMEFVKERPFLFYCFDDTFGPCNRNYNYYVLFRYVCHQVFKEGQMMYSSISHEMEEYLFQSHKEHKHIGSLREMLAANRRYLSLRYREGSQHMMIVRVTEAAKKMISIWADCAADVYYDRSQIMNLVGEVEDNMRRRIIVTLPSNNYKTRSVFLKSEDTSFTQEERKMLERGTKLFQTSHLAMRKWEKTYYSISTQVINEEKIKKIQKFNMHCFIETDEKSLEERKVVEANAKNDLLTKCYSSPELELDMNDPKIQTMLEEEKRIQSTIDSFMPPEKVFTKAMLKEACEQNPTSRKIGSDGIVLFISRQPHLYLMDPETETFSRHTDALREELKDVLETMLADPHVETANILLDVEPERFDELWQFLAPAFQDDEDLLFLDPKLRYTSGLFVAF